MVFSHEFVEHIYPRYVDTLIRIARCKEPMAVTRSVSGASGLGWLTDPQCGARPTAPANPATIAVAT